MPELLDMYLGYYFYVKSDGDERQVAERQACHVELARDSGTVEPKDMGKVLRYMRKNRTRLLAIWTSHFKHSNLIR